MNETDALISRFAALPTYGPVNIVCYPGGAVKLYASRKVSSHPLSIPTVQIDAPTLAEGLAGMIEAFGRANPGSSRG